MLMKKANTEECCREEMVAKDGSYSAPINSGIFPIMWWKH